MGVCRRVETGQTAHEITIFVDYLRSLQRITSEFGIRRLR